MDPKVIGPIDAELSLATAGTTLTASANGTALDLGPGYAPGGGGRPCQALVQVTGYDHTDGNESYAAKVQESDDGTTYVDASPTVTLTNANTDPVPATGGPLLLGFFSRRRFVRLAWTIAGTSPSIVIGGAWVQPRTVAG